MQVAGGGAKRPAAEAGASGGDKEAGKKSKSAPEPGKGKKKRRRAGGAGGGDPKTGGKGAGKGGAGRGQATRKLVVRISWDERGKARKTLEMETFITAVPEAEEVGP